MVIGNHGSAGSAGLCRAPSLSDVLQPLTKTRGCACLLTRPPFSFTMRVQQLLKGKYALSAVQS